MNEWLRCMAVFIAVVIAAIIWLCIEADDD
jgi:hypothetical protein